LDYVKNSNLSFLNAVLKGVFTVPGDGIIDYSSIFKLLNDNDYEGWLVIEAEQDPSIAEPLIYARMGYENILKLAKETNLNINQI
jgi:inosose dehydratase